MEGVEGAGRGGDGTRRGAEGRGQCERLWRAARARGPPAARLWGLGLAAHGGEGVLVNSQGVLFVGDTRVAAGTGTPGEEGRGGGWGAGGGGVSWE